jgi:PAS domain S-box-containing protein
VGVAIDLGRLGTTLIEDLAVAGQGTAFLATEDGGLLLASGWDRSGPAGSLGELIGPEWREALQRPAGEPDAKRWVVRLGAVGGRERLLGVSEPIGTAGGELVLGALVPAAWAVRGVRPILLGAMFLLAVFSAGAVTALVSWRRARAGQAASALEADRWRGLAERREREGRWRGLSDHSPAPVVCLLGTRVVAANLAAAVSLAGGERDRLVGQDFLAFAADSDREILRRQLERQRTDGDVRQSTVVRLRAAGGRDFVARVAAAGMREFDKDLVYVSWEEVGPGQPADAVLEALAGGIPLAVVLTDPSGNLIWANAAAFERGGDQLRRLKGQPLLRLVERSHWRVVLAALARARRGRTDGGHVRVVGKDGDVLPAEFKVFPVRTGEGVTGVMFVMAETGTPAAGSREFPAAARERALSHLATSLAHRVSNNFQGLLGFLEELKGGTPAEQTVMAARSLVSRSVDDLRRFVAVSRSGSGVLRPVRLGHLLVRWVEKIKPGLPARVRLTVRREAKDDKVVADASQLLLWLDVSLASALPELELGGAVEVSLRDGRASGTLNLTFSDTGAQDDVSEGSDAQRELYSSRREARALADLIATRLGGRSGGRFRPGMGWRSWLELPRVAGDAGAESARRKPARTGAVLLADDEEMVRTPLALSLRNAGYEVVEAGNGLEAVEKVSAAPHRFALVVLDLVMPVMDGREALRRLRAQTPAVPVIICTGYDPSGDDVLAAADILIKPFSIEEFLAKVAELTGSQPDGDANGDSMTQ